jgi:hypothetical protein
VLIEERTLGDAGLRVLLDAAFQELVSRYGGEGRSGVHPDARYLGALVDDRPVGCGVVQPAGPTVGELKRMFVLPEHRHTIGHYGAGGSTRVPLLWRRADAVGPNGGHAVQVPVVGLGLGAERDEPSRRVRMVDDDVPLPGGVPYGRDVPPGLALVERHRDRRRLRCTGALDLGDREVEPEGSTRRHSAVQIEVTVDSDVQQPQRMPVMPRRGRWQVNFQ